MMRKLLGVFVLAAALPLGAAELQGYLADWNCVKKIVKNGAEQTFKNNKNCSLQTKYQRKAYGLITDDKKFYRLDDAGNKHALELLPKSPSRDQLHVIVTGDVSGGAVEGHGNEHPVASFPFIAYSCLHADKPKDLSCRRRVDGGQRGAG